MKRPEDWINSELAAQCVMPRLDAELYFTDTDYKNAIHKLIIKGIGGFCIFKGNMDKVAKMTEELQLIADIPLLFSADYEHGLPMRLDDGTDFPHAMALGISDQAGETYKIAKAIAVECKEIGVQWNFAPVCDVNSNPSNPIINIRSFGNDPELVARHSEKYIEGLQSENIIACAKHFPGHGDTGVDSHLELPLIYKTLDELENPELLPFVNAIQKGVKSIMIGHIALPNIDPSGLPASLSPVFINKILREKLGYTGLIVTDALDMKAISSIFPDGSASVKCIEAGADVVLIAPDNNESIRLISAEAERNPEFRQKLISSVKRIIEAKRWANLFAHNDLLNQEKLLYFPAHEKLALKSALAAVRIFGGENLLPLPEDVQIACYAILQSQDIDSASNFFRIFSQAVENDMDYGFIDEEIDDEQIEEFADMTKDAGYVVFAYFYRARAYKGSISIPEDLKAKLKNLSAGKKVISILFGNPYLIDDIESQTTIVCYSDSLSSIAASVLKLSGKNIDFNQF